MIAAELATQKVPLPNELILDVIRVESGGQTGNVNPKSGASGLMQVMPGTLKDFNKRHGYSYTLDDMRSASEEAAKKQIRVGIAVLAHYWRQAYKYLTSRMATVPIDELAHVADLFYAAGPGATQKRLDKLPMPTWAAIQTAYPNWAAIPHPTKIFATPKPWNLSAIGSWLESAGSKIPAMVQDPRTGFAMGVLLLMAAYWWLDKKGKPK